MSNLTLRLRDRYLKHSQELRDDAADHIEELEAELDKMWKLVDYSGLSVDEAMTVLAQMKENDDGL